MILDSLAGFWQFQKRQAGALFFYFCLIQISCSATLLPTKIELGGQNTGAARTISLSFPGSGERTGKYVSTTPLFQSAIITRSLSALPSPQANAPKASIPEESGSFSKNVIFCSLLVAVRNSAQIERAKCPASISGVAVTVNIGNVPPLSPDITDDACVSDISRRRTFVSSAELISSSFANKTRVKNTPAQTPQQQE